MNVNTILPTRVGAVARPQLAMRFVIHATAIPRKVKSAGGEITPNSSTFCSNTKMPHRKE